MLDNSTFTSLNSPFKWVGGKSRLRNYIIPLIPQHTCFVDLFCGAGWVLFGKPPSDVEVLNDIDQELINFFRVVKHQPEALIESFELELVARAEFERLADLEPGELTAVQRAHRFYYLIMAGWGGELRYPRFQTSIRDGGHGNRLFGALKHLRQRIEPVHRRLSTVIIENLGWHECFKRYDSVNTFFYVDPPYPGNNCNYAHNMREWSSHDKLYASLRASKGKWILSSYDMPNIHETFNTEAYHILPVQSYSGMRVAKHNTKRVKNEEVLVLNFPPAEVGSKKHTSETRQEKHSGNSRSNGQTKLPGI